MVQIETIKYPPKSTFGFFSGVPIWGANSKFRKKVKRILMSRASSSFKNEIEAMWSLLDLPAQETRDPVSIVFETNGRCEPHRILVWKDGKDEGSATVLEVDRFGAIKNPDAEDDRR